MLGVVVLGGMWVKFSSLEVRHDHFWMLAESFWEGKTYFVNLPKRLDDTISWRGKYYWPLGPGPAVWLMPWVAGEKAIGWKVHRGYLNLATGLVALGVGWWIARRAGYGISDAGYLAAALVFGSVFLESGFGPLSWRFSHVLTVLFSILALAEYMSHRRYWVIGILMSVVLATRMTAGLGVVFFGLMVWWDRSLGLGQKLGKLVQFGLPTLLTVVILGGYNYARFGSFVDMGYMRANTLYKWEKENYGLFKLRNIPTNFYFYFLKTVDPVLEKADTSYYLKWPYVKAGYPGVGFWVVAPVFLYIFRADVKRLEVKAAAVTAGLIILVLLTYYWVGWDQVGPRYMNDALPWLYVLLVYAFAKRKLTGPARMVILASSYFNLWLLVSSGL